MARFLLISFVEISFPRTLVAKKGIKEVFLPIFIDVREFVQSVPAEVMEQWKHREIKDTSDKGMDFYEIAKAIGKERAKSRAFIGTDSIPDREIELAFNQAMYIFAVDFEGGKVREVK